MSKKVIVIKEVQGADLIEIKDLREFQGELKTLSQANSDKMRDLFLKYGFAFPLFVWKNNILDGHQRKIVLEKLIDQGYEIVDEKGNPTTLLPVIRIKAKNKKEAKMLLLAFNSKFGLMTEEGFFEFLQDIDTDYRKIKDLIDFPEIDPDLFEVNFYDGEGLFDSLEQGGVMRRIKDHVEEFAMTLLLPKEHEEAFGIYIKENGKQDLVEVLINHVTGSGD